MPVQTKFINLLRFSIPLVLFLLIAIFLWKGLQHDPRILPSALINHPVPKFHAPSLETPQHIIDQTQFLGQISLLNVWASWCTACREEQSALLDIARSKKVIIFGLNYEDDRFEAQRWLVDFGNPYQDIIFDDKGVLGLDLGVYGIPETFIIDKKGIIRYKHVGGITAKVWQEELWPQIQKLQAVG